MKKKLFRAKAIDEIQYPETTSEGKKYDVRLKKYRLFVLLGEFTKVE